MEWKIIVQLCYLIKFGYLFSLIVREVGGISLENLMWAQGELLRVRYDNHRKSKQFSLSQREKVYLRGPVIARRGTGFLEIG